MKLIRNMILALAALVSAACSGNLDDQTSSLKITADKTEISADGIDKVTFRVSYGSQDVSASKDMTLTWEKDGLRKDMAAGTSSFSTIEAGTYVFHAQYKTAEGTVTSEKISITAKAVEVKLSGYYRKMLAMEFTSIFCTYCPILAEAVENIEKAYPGRIIPVAFHCDNMGTDPFTLPLNGKFYEMVINFNDDGLPLFAFDMRKSSRDIINEYAKIESEMKAQLEAYPAVCGVAVSNIYDPSSRKMEVEAKFKTDMTGEYRCHIFLVEDGIEYTQAGHEGSTPYVHENMVRAIASDNIFGSKLNKGSFLEPGTEYTYTKTFILDEEWNEKNIRVVACMLRSDLDGNFHVNNSNECSIAASAGYLYEE